ncbi:hypothetical protein J2Z44_001696 [Clostridium punense]|uniref:Phage late control gene D protein (GPD) n=1 Tax=Clostridium punense TaxID=1054297 RepID=A0ABS4K3S0_9CLOT|nr:MULTISPECIES: contractile injection system protein, VgrG/Pvc8 family [Clostridium]MBP2021900.1 hypothetical protein [Clostridium punense]
MIGFHNIRVKSPYNIKIIEDIKIECRLNNHGKLYLKAIIDEKEEFNHAVQATLNDEIHLYEKNGQEEKTIFKGLVASAKVKKESNVYHLEIEGISGSFKLDTKQKSRSFQDINKKYAEIAKEVVKDYPQHNFAATIGEGVKIQVPIIQYQETDWELLKRLASKLNSVVVCDIMEKGPRVYFGLPKGESYTLGDDTLYSAKKDLLAFKKAGGYEEGLHDTDFFTYEIESLSKYNIGDEINFKKKKLYVTEINGYMEGSILKFKYILSRKNGIVQREIYNNKIKGMCLEGKILEVKNELVKLHLNIDKTQEKSKAYWFPFSPPTGNVMYCMPKVGTDGTLYFPEATADKANVIGCSRKNGGSCSKTGNPNNRYLGTEHGSELEITPSAINIDSGSKKPLKITIDDNTGITITSHKKLTLNASQNIAFYTPKKVVINAKTQILAKKKDALSGFSIDNEFHFLGTDVSEEGRDRETYNKYTDDEPLQGQPPKAKNEGKKKKGFDWGKLAKNVVAGIAVVAVVALSAAFVISTCGAGAAAIAGGVAAIATAADGIATAAAIGAATMGAMGIYNKAKSDIERGEVSDGEEFADSVFKDAFIGAVCGALFEPLIAVVAGGGLVGLPSTAQVLKNFLRAAAIGGGYNYTYYGLREMVDGRTPTMRGYFNAFSEGAVFGAGFHIGGALISKPSPFIEKGSKGVSNASNTVWDNIKITQPMYEGTKIPKSFEITSGGEKFWVHPNGTKHMVEYITKDAMSHGMPMNSQTLLSSFENSVSGAVKQGINYDKIMNVGNWELIFSKPRGDGLLPVIKHAVYRP